MPEHEDPESARTKQIVGGAGMPRKQYKNRIDRGLAEFRAAVNIHDPLFDRKSSAARVGEMFQMLADDFEDGLGGQSVQNLFRDAGFSPQSPFHWGYLMTLLAGVHYTDGKRGHPVTRTPERRKMLKRDLEALARKYDEYRVEYLAKLYVEKCPDRIKSLKRPDGVKTAIRAFGIKISKPANHSRKRKTSGGPERKA